MSADGFNGTWNGHTGKNSAVHECLHADGGDGGGDNYGRQAIKVKECVITYRGDGVWDDRTWTSPNQCIAGRLDISISLLSVLSYNPIM